MKVWVLSQRNTYPRALFILGVYTTASAVKAVLPGLDWETDEEGDMYAAVPGLSWAADHFEMDVSPGTSGEWLGDIVSVASIEPKAYK